MATIKAPLLLALSFTCALTALADTGTSQQDLSQATQEAMQSAKEAAASVSLKELISNSESTAVVPGYGSDVSDLSAYYDKGQGDLLTPGSAKADGCLDLNTPECQAVQVIYETNQRPGYNESEFDGLLNDRDQIVSGAGNADLGVAGSGSLCETVTMTVPARYEYEVCEESSGSVSENCFAGWAEKLEFSTLFSCIKRTGKLVNVTCSENYVASVQEYSCLEAPRQNCIVGKDVEVSSEYIYECSRKTYAAQSYRCNKVLSVVATPTCETAAIQADEVHSSALGQDPCDGGDAIYVSYTCQETSAEATPKIRIETNIKNAPRFGFDVTAADFDEERTFSNCKGRWSGNTRCNGSSCITQINMKIYPYVKGNYVYSGELSKVFSFQKYSAESAQDVWTMTCNLEENALKEAAAP